MTMVGINEGNDPYIKTATGLLGDKRETMLENQLLLRCDMGQPMHRGYVSYPCGPYGYGVSTLQTDGGVPEAMRMWSSSLPKPVKKVKKVKLQRDFMALNNAAVHAGFSTASENYQFRAIHDVRHRIPDTDLRKNLKPMRFPSSMVFGISTRSTTPMYDLLEHRYQDLWLTERNNMDIAKRRAAVCKHKAQSLIYNTHTQLLKNHQIPVESPPLWHMPRFTRKSNGEEAKANLETFRDKKSKELAFENMKSDCIGREGMFGQGINKIPKN